jgi:hypothetical protein
VKQTRHRHDEPTILPSNCTAIVFEPDGGVVMYVGADIDTQSKAQVSPATFNVVRAALLFGSGEDCERMRDYCDNLIQQQRKRKA